MIAAARAGAARALAAHDRAARLSFASLNSGGGCEGVVLRERALKAKPTGTATLQVLTRNPGKKLKTVVPVSLCVASES